MNQPVRFVGGETVRRLARWAKTRPRTALGLSVLVALALVSASCRSPQTHQSVTKVDDGWPKATTRFQTVAHWRMRAELPVVEGAEYVGDDELCAVCHEAYANYFQKNVHRGIHEGQSCEGCHGPASRHLETRGKEPGMILSFKTMEPAQKSEVCSKCHEQDQCSPAAQFRYSTHAHRGVACTDCHRAHYNVPPGTPPTTELGLNEPIRKKATARLARFTEEQSESLRGTSNALGAVAPDVCYKCHGDMVVYQQLAGPHQICGPNGFNCTTCHNPHGQVVEESRRDLCLQCHNTDAPTMAFHSSTHDLAGVACTDCHDPHPKTDVPRVVNVNHERVKRPPRQPMSVDEPDACYQCHQKIYALAALPSHHPIREGKMVCSDCHDPHGQSDDDLKEASLNQVCYKCHADKEGPFAFEHPPASENCGYCHEAHGTVANNLLRQPPTFLCLRCHTGHRSGLYNTDEDPDLQRNLYTNCTYCHKQIHGSDLPSQTGLLPAGTYGHRLTR